MPAQVFWIAQSDPRQESRLAPLLKKAVAWLMMVWIEEGAEAPAAKFSRAATY